MPAKPAWYGRLEQIVAELEALPGPWVDRSTLEFLLGVGPRRAQQIMAVCATERVGTSSLADRLLLSEHLRQLAAGEDGIHEKRRRRRRAAAVEEMRQTWISRPQVLVEAPVAIVNQRWEDLPAGIELEPGRITVCFETPRQALERLLALAMAIGNNFQRFEDRICPDNGSSPLPRPAPPVE